MSFWSPRQVELCSRIVEARTQDGTLLRAKVTIVFHTPCSARDAEAAVARYAELVVQGLENPPHGMSLEERTLSVHLMSRTDVRRHLRRLDVSGLHVVGSGVRPIAARGR